MCLGLDGWRLFFVRFDFNGMFSTRILLVSAMWEKKRSDLSLLCCFFGGWPFWGIFSQFPSIFMSLAYLHVFLFLFFFFFPSSQYHLVISLRTSHGSFHPLRCLWFLFSRNCFHISFLELSSEWLPYFLYQARFKGELHDVCFVPTSFKFPPTLYLISISWILF